MQRRVQRYGVAAAVLVTGLAVALTWPRLPGPDSADVRFARDMSAHHTQAVTMSVTLLKRAADPAVKLLAQDITLTQQAQIGQMSGWLMAWGHPLSGPEAPMAGMNREAMGLATPEEVQQLGTVPVATAERQYLSLMRDHHLGGVAMAQSALSRVKRSEVRAFAERTVVAQTSEVRAIDALLGQRGMQPSVPRPAGSMPMEQMNHE
ncbi:DUF305 domain-containing protein [Deinococcus sp. QL22]|uniref:DUF305 domain-containing protein n=1 Tax=Deinococcus sp. QL22 TaxID=2939437 RepID=UPI002016CB01|nr:DUF305 domain-containing protein [Deinococcus sp. QL22]UQN08072.1 DUF305 domain-containing protein [Deinococcus sp. QL22]